MVTVMGRASSTPARFVILSKCKNLRHKRTDFATETFLPTELSIRTCEAVLAVRVHRNALHHNGYMQRLV